jgi:hypothetical protein
MSAPEFDESQVARSPAGRFADQTHDEADGVELDHGPPPVGTAAVEAWARSEDYLQLEDGTWVDHADQPVDVDDLFAAEHAWVSGHWRRSAAPSTADTNEETPAMGRYDPARAAAATTVLVEPSDAPRPAGDEPASDTSDADGPGQGATGAKRPAAGGGPLPQAGAYARAQGRRFTRFLGRMLDAYLAS